MPDDITDAKMREDLEHLRRGQRTGHSGFDSIGRVIDVWIKAAIEGITPGEVEARRERYQEYLQTQTWWGKRQAILARADGRCEECGIANVPLEVHHKTYGARGKEKSEQLVALCPTCHSEAHK